MSAAVGIIHITLTEHSCLQLYIQSLMYLYQGIAELPQCCTKIQHQHKQYI